MIDDATMIAHSLSSDDGSDRCMATSGDYRNYFEVEGVRYSHTIDPRTASPVQHSLASVSVVSDSCMKADAWATALGVLGPEEGLEVARREGLSVLVASRGEDAFDLVGTGTLAGYSAKGKSKDELASQTAQTTQAVTGNSNALATVAFTVLAFAMILFAMAIGVIFGRKAISGSCGGLANSTNEDGSTSCSLCSNPADACKELRERMSEKTAASSGSEV
jgi:thiamine biosynthesis lipoprotein